MLKLAADENFNADIVRGVRRRRPKIDFRTVHEADLVGESDPVILEWAADENQLWSNDQDLSLVPYTAHSLIFAAGLHGVVALSEATGMLVWSFGMDPPERRPLKP